MKSQTNGPGKKLVLQHENGETSIRLLATELVDGMPSTVGYLSAWQPGETVLIFTVFTGVHHRCVTVPMI